MVPVDRFIEEQRRIEEQIKACERDVSQIRQEKTTLIQQYDLEQDPELKISLANKTRTHCLNLKAKKRDLMDLQNRVDDIQNILATIKDSFPDQHIGHISLKYGDFLCEQIPLLREKRKCLVTMKEIDREIELCAATKQYFRNIGLEDDNNDCEEDIMIAQEVEDEAKLKKVNVQSQMQIIDEQLAVLVDPTMEETGTPTQFTPRPLHETGGDRDEGDDEGYYISEQ
jgi:hypothetical protein